MSIIYNTLNRLEMDNSALAENLDKASPPHLAGKSMRFPVKVLATATMLVFVGTSLMVWHWNDPWNDSSALSLANAGSQTVVGGTSDHLLSPVPTGGQATHESQSAVQNRELATLADQLAEPSTPRPAKVASDAGKQPKKENGSSLQAGTGEKTSAEANVKLAVIEAPRPKSKPKLKVTHKPKQPAQVVSSVNMAQPNKVDQSVERARLALSRGQYQQALTALETLSPAPKRRVDFWLIKGSVHLGLGQLDQAEKALASAQLLAPANAQIAVQRAILKQEKGDHVSALQILKDAATHNSNVPEIFLNQGYSQQALGDVRDARHSFRIFLEITEGRSLYAEQRKVVTEWLVQFSSASN